MSQFKSSMSVLIWVCGRRHAQYSLPMLFLRQHNKKRLVPRVLIVVMYLVKKVYDVIKKIKHFCLISSKMSFQQSAKTLHSRTGSPENKGIYWEALIHGSVQQGQIC